MSTLPADTTIIPAQRADDRHGVRAVVQSIVSKAMILGLQAATGILTARALGPAGRGELAAMILWPLFVSSVTTFGVPSSLIYYLRHQPEERERFIANGFVITAVLGVIAGLLTLPILPWWLHQYSPQVVRAARWFLLAVPICSVTLAGRAVLEASHDFSASNAIQTLTPFATLLGLLFFFGIHRFDPYTAGLAYIVSSVPAFLFMLLRVRRLSVMVWDFQKSAVQKIFGYGIRSYGIDLLGTLALQVDQVLVVSLLSPSAMGSYVVVLSLSRTLNLFQNSVVMVLFPKATGQSIRTVVGMTGESARATGLVTAACGIPVCLAGPFLLQLIYGNDYVSAVGALRILVLEVILSGTTYVLAQAFMALNRPGVVTILQAIGLSLSVPMMLVLIPRYGIYGAAVSLLTSTIARLIFVYIGFRVFLKTESPSLLPDGSDIRLLWSVVKKWSQERAA
jgi:O-antigen/teichoic acid export membrane protein